jgi:serine/threonine-protein kinase RsbW
VAAARRAAVGTAAELGAAPDCLDDIALALSEACTNAVLHAYRGGDVGEFKVAVGSDDDSVRVLVTDFGCGMRPRSDSPGLGLGLPLIAHVAESMQLLRCGNRQGTTLCMAFPRCA